MAAAKQACLWVHLFTILARISSQTGDECGVSNIYITNDDGSEKVFSVRHVHSLDGADHDPQCSPQPLQPGAGQGHNQNEGQRFHTTATVILDRPENGHTDYGSTVNQGVDSLGDLITLLNRDGGYPRSQFPMPIIGVFSWNSFSLCDKLSGGQQTLCTELGKLRGDKGSGQTAFTKANNDKIKELGLAFVEHKLLPISAEDESLDKKLAHGLILLSLGMVESSITHFSSMLKRTPNVIGAYYCRSLTYIHLGQQSSLEAALKDINTAYEMDKSNHEIRQTKAQIMMMNGRIAEVEEYVEGSFTFNKERGLFLRGTYRLLTNDLLSAEKDLRVSAQKEGPHSNFGFYNMAVTLFYRGKIRTAIEVLRELLRKRKDHFESHLALAYCYRELSDFRRFKISLNSSLHLQPKSLKTLQLKALTAYQRGQFDYAASVMESCLSIDPTDTICLYFKGLIHTASGKLYTAVLSHTKATAYSTTPQLQLSPEFIQAHYLREYSRYLHHKLDGSIMHFDLDAHLNPVFKSSWVHQALHFVQDIEAMPGIQANINDVDPLAWSSLPNATKLLLCAAKRIGNFTEVSVDGQLPRPRINLAMGLAAIHVSQLLKRLWSETQVPDFKSIPLEVLQLVSKYLQIADPEMPVVFSDNIPNFSTAYHFIRGYTVSPRLNSYFEIVYKLIKSMLHHQSDSQYATLAKDLQTIHTSNELLKLMKYSSLPPDGLSLAMQVPSTRDTLLRLEGGVITLGSDSSKKLLFNLSLRSHVDRSKAFSREISSLYHRISREIRTHGSRTKDQDAEQIVDSILSVLYYIYNWAPLSRSTGLVAYTLAIGMVLSFGWEVTGRLPPGKLLELEALLAGKPETFVIVSKFWMNLKQQSDNSNIADLPLVTEALPTVRNLIEVLNLPKLVC